MTPVVLLKGDDVSVFINNETVSGVFSLEIKETTTYYEICQYLSGEYVEKIPLKREYDLVLSKAYTNENPFEDYIDFTLSVNCGGKITTYEPCILLEEECAYSQSNTLEAVYKIKAYEKYSQGE